MEIDAEKTLHEVLVTICKDEAYQVTFQGKNKIRAYNDLIGKKEGVREVADVLGKMHIFDNFSKQIIHDYFMETVGL